MAHAGHARNFEWVLRELAARGHPTRVAAGTAEPGAEPLRTIGDELDAVEVVEAPELRGARARTARRLRLVGDYARYLEEPYARADALRRRAALRLPGPPAAARVLATPVVGRLVTRLADEVEQRIPPPPEAVELIEAAAPDVVLVTPLVEFGSDQVEYVRAARALGIPTALLVASWDNLTVKGGFHVQPDLVAVWNEVQLREALELHGVSADRVVVTGAVAFDHWFDWRGTGTGAELRQRLGLAADVPVVLYVGSSRFTAPDEGEFVLAWAQAVRGGLGRDVQILVRPHPENPLGRAGDRLRGLDGVVVHPPAGENPTTAASRRDYYDSIQLSSAVVGINTTAFLEAAILGRPTYTIRMPRFRGTQDQTLHFHYLLAANGGPVLAADSLADHLVDLRSGLSAGGSAVSTANRTFLQSFVRPCGLGVPASSRLVDAVEELAGRRGPANAASVDDASIDMAGAAAQ